VIKGDTKLFCSTIIPTVGRSTLSRAVESVLEQGFPSTEYEVIVVNDSGESLPFSKWQQSKRVQVINTYRRERSIARNTGAAVAKGRYLHFLDDDDWLAPGAFQHFWSLSKSSNAQWLYGASQLVDRQDLPTIQLRHGLNGNCFIQVMAGEWIPLQSSFIDQETFFKVGGFNPLLSGPEDIDLLRRICLIGDIAETPDIVAYIARGDEGSTTDYPRHAQASRWAREIILESPGVFSKMRSSAKNPSWGGRMFRVYLTSLVWNIQHRRLFAAISRASFAMATLFVNSTWSFSKDFWRSLTKHYDSGTFKKGFKEAANI
jgi:glycosyltransferase involved in cell wall biosynthesis